MRPLTVSSTEDRDKLKEIYEKQGFVTVITSKGALKAYRYEDGKLKYVVKVSEKDE